MSIQYSILDEGVQVILTRYRGVVECRQVLIAIFMAGGSFEKIGMKCRSNPSEAQGLNQCDRCRVSCIDLG